VLVTPPHTNAAEVTGKIIQEVTTAFVINRVDPYIYLIKFKKRMIWPGNFGVLALDHRNKQTKSLR